MIVSAVINDSKNTKDDKLPEDVLKLMEYVPVDEKGDTMEDLGDHMEVLQTEGDTTKQVDTLEELVKSDDEGQEAETITVKLTLKQENIPALGDDLEVLDVLEHVEDDAEGEVHMEGTKALKSAVD